MDKKVKVSASVLCADFSRLAQEVKQCEEAGVDMFHVDVMDGHFVPNITIGPVVVQAMRPLTKLPIDVHLMIENPWVYIEQFIKAGADVISIQTECYGSRRADCRRFGQFPKEVDKIYPRKARRDILKIKQLGKKAVMAINPGTPLCLNDLLSELDGVLVMSVNPGFTGQKFMPEVVKKIRELRKGYAGDITIDGGINAETAPKAIAAGANVLVTASYLFGAVNREETVKRLQAIHK